MKVADILVGWDVPADSSVVGDPLHQVAALLVWDVKNYLFIHLHGALGPWGHSQGVAVAGVTGCHLVLGIRYLLGEVWHRQGLVLWLPPLVMGVKLGMKKCR